MIICFAAIITVALTYFIGSESNTYGNRLNKQVAIPADWEIKLQAKIKEESPGADLTCHNCQNPIRTIYLTINFKPQTSLEDAKIICQTMMNTIDAKILAYYDFNLTIIKPATEDEAAWQLMGAQNSKGTGLIWTNNTPEPLKEEK